MTEAYKMKTVKVQGGAQYTSVAERVKKLRVEYPDHDLHGEIVNLEMNNGECAEVVIRYVVSTGSPGQPGYRVHASGIAHERRSAKGVNSTSHIENCDTSAMGRALGCFGIGVDESFGSADEYLRAIAQETARDTAAVAAPASELPTSRTLDDQLRRGEEAPIGSSGLAPLLDHKPALTAKSDTYRGPYASPAM